MSLDLPVISVILPVYNAEEYIFDSLQSILNQSFGSFEVIVINDGSTDNSESIILQFKDIRIRYIKNEVNLKLIATLNLGLDLARGKYIARLDADDIAFPNRFEKQVAFLEKNSDYGIVGSYAKEFGKSTEVIKYVLDDESLRFALITHNPFVHSAIMFRYSIVKQYNLQFDKNCIHVEDYDLWIKILTYTKGQNIPEILVNYRVHDLQISFQYRDLQIQNTRILQTKYLDNIMYNYNNWNGLIVNLLNMKKNNISDLIKFLKYVSFIVDYQDDLQIRVVKQAVKIAKNQLLDSDFSLQLNMSDLLIILKFFTFKQKLTFLKKLLFKKKGLFKRI